MRRATLLSLGLCSLAVACAPTGPSARLHHPTACHDSREPVVVLTSTREFREFDGACAANVDPGWHHRRLEARIRNNETKGDRGNGVADGSSRAGASGANRSSTGQTADSRSDGADGGGPPV